MGDGGGECARVIRGVVRLSPGDEARALWAAFNERMERPYTAWAAGRAAPEDAAPEPKPE